MKYSHKLLQTFVFIYFFNIEKLDPHQKEKHRRPTVPLKRKTLTKVVFSRVNEPSYNF